MLRKPLTWLFALALWIIGGGLLGNLICCGGGLGALGLGAKSAGAVGAAGAIGTKAVAGTLGAGALGAGLLIKDGASTIASLKSGNLIYGLSGAKHTFQSAAAESEFGKLAGYLKANPGKTVTLDGHYLSTEDNNTKFQNLGFARANSIKSYLIGLGVPASQILTGSILKDNLNIDGNNIIGGIDYRFGALATGAKSINIADANAFSTSEDDNFVFPKSSYNYDTPISGKLKGAFSKTAEYLKGHPNRSLKITGFYTDMEKNSSVLPNLGLARANKIKSLLLGLGVASSQIELGSQVSNGLVFDGANKVVGPASYAFYEKATNNNRLIQVEKALRANPLTLYFQTGSNTINLSAQQRQYLADLMYYVDNKEGAGVNITGHTDNRGAIELNKNLSKRRAQFVKDYFSKNGINTKSISTLGMGPDQPVADNATSEGRAKNRRVEVTIK